jgi:tetratricopeptide (TPR) repeat protein
MLIPYPLSWDYSFNQIPIRNFTDGVSILSLALYLSVAGLIFYYFKKQPVISFGLIFFMILITPTANVFFINGTTFADRFLFLPSFGFILAVVLLIMTFRKLDAELPSPSHKNYLMIAAGIILSGFGYLTIKRNADWSSNYAVFKSGALNSPNSSRTNDGLATTYMNIAQETSDPRIRDLYVDSSIRYYQKSLEIYPDNNKSSYSLGFIYAMQGQKDLAIKYYRQSIASKPDYTLSLTNLGSLYANMGNNDSAYYFFTRSIKANPNDDVTLTNMCIVSLNLGKTDEAIQWGEKVISMGKGNQKIYNTLSLAYERKGDMNKALEYRMKN